MVRRELITAWSDRPAGAIERSDVIAMVRDVRSRRGASAARKALAQASRVFSWALGNDLGGVKFNACTGIRTGDIIGSIAERHHVLSDQELRAVWNASEEVGYPFGLLYQLLLLTGCLLKELAKARWSEVESDIITVPAIRMKGNLPHVVPLTGLALRLLETVPRFDGPHIFTTTGGRRPVSGFSKAKARLDRLITEPVEQFVVHDFRRTVRTGLSRLGVVDHVAERVVAHIDGGVKRTYNRYSYLSEKRAALEAWSTRPREIVGTITHEGNGTRKPPSLSSHRWSLKRRAPTSMSRTDPGTIKRRSS